jgi:anti-sigma factor RsiW
MTMTTTTPGCDETLARLDDYVDGALDEAAFQEVELHLAGCADCAAEHRMLRELLAHAAALPRAIAPPRDLWPGVAERLGERRPSASRFTLGLAAAAALAVAVTLLSRPGPQTREGTPATVPVAAATEGLPPALEQAEAEYARATAQLLAAVEARRAALPPRTVAALEENLKTIDAALDEVRTALRSDPSNPHLNLLLASTHQRKVEVLRQVVRFTT